MEDTKTAVFGISAGVAQAETAVDALVHDRHCHEAISVLLPDHQGSKDFAHEKHTKAPEGTTTGVAAGGTIGGLIGALVGRGLPEYEAKRYEGRVKGGGVLLCVHCDSSEEITRAKEVLKRTGAAGRSQDTAHSSFSCEPGPFPAWVVPGRLCSSSWS